MVKINIVFKLFLLPVVAAVNFNTCLADVRQGNWGTIGGTDNHGRPVPDIANATAITYDLCLHACGATPEPFVWSVFAQHFSSWLLPWLALVSQLPFGANDKLDNLVSALLTVGSPTLAAYSLALTVLNGRWIARHFRRTAIQTSDTLFTFLAAFSSHPSRLPHRAPSCHLSLCFIRMMNGGVN